MAQNWISRVAHKAQSWGRVFRTPPPRPRGSSEIDADARRMRAELDAIRARFQDHS